MANCIPQCTKTNFRIPVQSSPVQWLVTAHSELRFSFSFNLDQRGTQSPLFHCAKTSQVIPASKNTLLPKMGFGQDRSSALPTELLKQHSRSRPS